MGSGAVRGVSARVRIPVPRITYDPLELMYEESQEIFHLGVYGLSVQPPFNRMLALALHTNAIFLCGGRDFDAYNTKSDAFYYTLADEPTQVAQGRTEQRPKYSANRFQKVASMNSKRYAHTGLYIAKIKSVLVFGGMNEREEVLGSCERYGVMDSKRGLTQIAGRRWPACRCLAHTPTASSTTTKSTSSEDAPTPPNSPKK